MKFTTEMAVFIVYLLAMLGIGVFFFFKDKNGGEKTFFLGDRKMGAWVAALSAGASDMSAWVLMGLPTAIYKNGMGEVWISAGLAIGYTISWLVQAPRLRKFSLVADDAITIPQYLTNRFNDRNRVLQIVCAVVFLVAYTIYAASSIKACGKLFNTVLGIDQQVAMYVAAIVIIGYTFLGGFSAVCWTDFFQGLLILGAMLLAPAFAGFMIDTTQMSAMESLPANYWNAFADWRLIVSGLSWGLGYFGMPHIIIRFMSIRSQKELKKSAKIGIAWTALIVVFAALIGIIGRLYLGYDLTNVDGKLVNVIAENELVFVEMVRKIFPALVSGVLLSAVLAAAMSTADSQLLAASSALASDVYKPLVRKEQAKDKELLWVGRIVVLSIAVVALLIASNPNSGSIMGLVSNAWGVFGAAFGPTILLSLFWRRFSFLGAVSGIVSGALIDVIWFVCLSKTGIYELLPGFVGGLIIAVVVTLLSGKASPEVERLFDEAQAYED